MHLARRGKRLGGESEFQPRGGVVLGEPGEGFLAVRAHVQAGTRQRKAWRMPGSAERESNVSTGRGIGSKNSKSEIRNSAPLLSLHGADREALLDALAVHQGVVEEFFPAGIGGGDAVKLGHGDIIIVLGLDRAWCGIA